MTSPDKITAFENQLQDSLNLWADDLHTKDKEKVDLSSNKEIAEIIKLHQENEQKFQELKSIASYIIDQIKLEREDDPLTKEVEQKYSADLKITIKELESIYKKCEKKRKSDPSFVKHNKHLFFNFNSFNNFLGLRDIYFGIDFAHSLQKVIIFGHKVDFAIPLGVNEEIIKNYEQALDQIRADKRFKTLITSDTKLIPRGDLRIEFKAGGTKYMATPFDIFTVDSQTEASPKQLEAWKKAEIRVKKLESASSFNFNQNLSENDLKNINEIIYENKNDLSIVPDKYKNEVKELKKAVEERNLLREKYSQRTLYDRENKKIIEENDLIYKSEFKHHYVDKNDQKIKTISYQENNKISEIDYFSDSEQIKKTTNFYINGNIDEVSTFLENGDLVTKKTFREDGTLFSEGNDSEENFYNIKGTEIMYKKIPPKTKDQKEKRFMIDLDSQLFGTIKDMKAMGKDMSDDQYLDYLALHLDTPEKMHYFIKAFFKYDADKTDIFTGKTSEMPNPDRSEGEYAQSPEQTIHVIDEDGYMRGDCEDLAILMTEILRRQKALRQEEELVYTLVFSGTVREAGHAFSACLEQDINSSKWYANGFDTGGLDQNGNRYGRKIDLDKAKGRDSIEESINLISARYKKKIIKNGLVDVLKAPIEGAVVRVSVPVDLLANREIVDDIVNAAYLTTIESHMSAVSTYEHLADKDPAHRDFYHQKIVEALKEQSKVEPDRSWLLKYSEIYSQRPEYHVALGEKYAISSQEAKEQFLLAVEKGTTDIDVYLKLYGIYKIIEKNPQKQVEILEKAQTNNIKFNYEAYVKLADSYISLDIDNDREKAIALLEKAIKDHPDMAENLKLRLAKIYHQTDQAKVIDIYQDLISQNPSCRSCYEKFANFYQVIGNHQERINILSLKIKNCDDLLPHDYENLAEAYIDNNNPQKVIDTYLIAIKKFPLGQKSLIIKLAKFYAENNYPQKAIETYEQLIVDYPQDENLNAILAYFCEQLLLAEHKKINPEVELGSEAYFNDDIFNKDFFNEHPELLELQNKRIEQYEEFFKKEGESYIFIILIGIYESMKDKKAIFRLYDLAIEKNIMSFYMLENMVSFYKKEGKISELIKIFETRIKQEKSSKYYMLMAKIYEDVDLKRELENYDLAIKNGENDQRTRVKYNYLKSIVELMDQGCILYDKSEYYAGLIKVDKAKIQIITVYGSAQKEIVSIPKDSIKSIDFSLANALFIYCKNKSKPYMISIKKRANTKKIIHEIQSKLKVNIEGYEK